MYNAQTRSIDAQLEFYFTSTPTVIDKSNYLVTFNLLEELGRETDSSIVGEVSANELDITLYNKDGMFSPSNTASPYYGMMRKGIKVVVKLKASASSEWDPMGTFYVNDWYAEITGLQARVYCYDKMHDVLNAALPAIPAMNNVRYPDAYKTLLSSLNVEHIVDESLVGSMAWWYTGNTVSATLRRMTNACLAAAFCDRSGAVRVLNLSTAKNAVANLSDGNQIISATVPQSINRDYDGLNVIINSAQLSDQANVLDIKELSVENGLRDSSAVAFSSRPVVRVETVKVSSNSELIDLLGYTCSTDAIIFKLRNDAALATPVSIGVYGRVIETIKAVYNQYGTSMFTFDNEYAQTEEVVARMNGILEKYIRDALPFLSLTIRGNPKVTLGDKVTVESTRYNLAFTGILQRAKYTYDGGLRCEVDLINSSVLEVS